MSDTSMVERYRMGEANGDMRMRLSDMEGERAIFRALQLYVDEVERLAIRRGEDISLYEMEPWQQGVVAEPTPYELEEKLRALWAVAEGDYGFAGVPGGGAGGGPSGAGSEESFALAEEVCAALFATRSGGFWGSPAAAAYPYVIPRDLWSHDEGRRPRRRDAVATPVNPLPDLAPVARWLKAALGSLVSQAEASRRLGLTEVGVKARVREGRLRAVRVGGNVMIPVVDLPAAQPGH